MDLRANTATTVQIGPAVDKDDALTPETGLGAGTVDALELWKAGATAAVDLSGVTMTHRSNGTYTFPATASHLDTVGPLAIKMFDADVCLPVVNYFNVLSESKYDEKYASQGTIIGQIQSVTADTPNSGILQIGISDPGLSSAADDQLNGWACHILDRSTREILDSGTVGNHTDATNLIYVDDLSITVTTGMDYRLDVMPKTSTTAGDVASVALVDDAITASKFDETTAYPLKSADTGSTAVARTGADGDTLETLSDEIATVGGNVDSILGDTGTDGVVISAATANAIADALLDRAAAIDGYTPRQVQAVLLAGLAGTLSGAAGTTITVKRPDGTQTRATVTVDENGNRSAVIIGTTGIV